MGRYWQLSVVLLAVSFGTSAVSQSPDVDCKDPVILAQAGDLSKVVKVARGVSSDDEDPNCPKEERLDELCDVIAGKSPEKTGSEYNFKFQRIIYESSCSIPQKESKQEIAIKVQKTWATYPDYFKCPFGLGDGNIVKLAAKNKFKQFIDAVAYWNIDISKPDEADGLTVLQYLDKEIINNEKNEGNAKRILIHYYEILSKKPYVKPSLR